MANKANEVFYDNLTRKELQSMCKIYGLPANKSHSELAKSLIAYAEEGKNGSMLNLKKMSHSKCNGNGLNHSEAQRIDIGEDLTLIGDGLGANMPQIICREINVGSCPAEAAFSARIESSTKVPSSFEYYVRSEEGINLYVDLNSSPSDWTKTFKNEVYVSENIQSNKCQNLHWGLGCSGEGDKELKRSFIGDISSGKIKDGHVHARSSSGSKMTISDRKGLDQQDKGDRLLSCNISVDVSEQLDEDQALNSFKLTSCAENHRISVAESCAKDGCNVVIHSDVIDPPQINLVCESAVNSISDGPLSHVTSEHQNSNLDECQNSTLKYVCNLADTAMVQPGCSVSGSIEIQSSEVASCHKEAPFSPCENGGLPGLVDPNHKTETEKGGLANSNELNPDAYENHLPLYAEEWERSNTTNGWESSECSQFSNTCGRTYFSSKNLDAKEELLQRKKKHIEGVHQSGYGKAYNTKILRSMKRNTRKDLRRRSMRLISKVF
ncbi:hypothetical protein FNV43_RR00354 [Rhamnella rubrinervis]|uniref:Uncharacterized protein n=1 Tax=Rhamnella rubrinervis TaxID=2594499 RepID=A0A8K0HMW0_9ROSA|nr:hypothetical protein FNV43_RR00354 [Rhamnella rubrinervis]